MVADADAPAISPANPGSQISMPSIKLGIRRQVNCLHDAYIQSMTKDRPAQIPAGQIFAHKQTGFADLPEWLPCESAVHYVLCDCKVAGFEKTQASALSQ
jgi:hypothetical protein